MATCQQSIKNKQKENNKNGYKPYCPFLRTCSISGSSRSSSKKNIGNYKLSITWWISYNVGFMMVSPI